MWFILGQYANRVNRELQVRLLYHKLCNSLANQGSMIEAAHSTIVSNRFRRRYSKELSALATTDKSWTKTDFPKIIWWCWLQGEDQAPELTKICLASLRRNLPDYDIRVVTWDNLDGFIKLPDQIFRKNKAGWISGAEIV